MCSEIEEKYVDYITGNCFINIKRVVVVVVVVVVCSWSPGRKSCPNYEVVWARTGLLL